MARLVVMRHSQSGKYDKGDVISVYPDGARLGMEVDLDEWELAGRDPALFPAHFYVIDLEGLSVDDAQGMLATDVDVEASGRRRASGFTNVEQLERRADPARQTLFTRHRIKRQWSEVSQQFKLKP